MDEHQQAEKTIGKASPGEEIIGYGIAEDTQPVQPFHKVDRDILGQLVPHQPITADPRGV